MINMEYEVRFYYHQNELNNILNNLSKVPNLKNIFRTYEKTIQYNHSDSRYDFYNKEIDGRFRVRISSNEKETKCKLSWKRRLKNTTETEVNKEEEKEVRINPDDIDNFLYIINNIMHFSIIESYERYRTVFENDDVEISVDEYPFGICIEIENKSTTKNPEDIVKEWTNKLGLNINDAYRLSWDDKYQELCKEQGIEVFNEVTFDKPMPVIKEKIKEILDLYNDNGERLNEVIERGNKPSVGKNIMLSVAYIKNSDGLYLIQKQSKEKGNKYSSTGGHVIHNENGYETIVREIAEELGINNIENKIKYITTFKYPTKSCIFNVYLLEIDNLDLSSIKLQSEEVAEITWYDKLKINELIRNGEFLETHAYIFQNYIDM